MGLRNFMSRRRTPAATTNAVTAPPFTSAGPKPSTLVDPADLEAARVELRQAMEESGVTSFRACSRDERHWVEDPEAMRAMADTFRSIHKHAAEDGLKDSPAR